MLGVTGDLYVGAKPFPGWDALTFVKKVNLSCGVSPYTRSQVKTALTNKYLWNSGTLNSSTASIMDRYIPNWQLVYMLAFNAPNFTGSASLAPSNYTQVFGALEDISALAMQNYDAWYIKLPNGHYIYSNGFATTGDIVDTRSVKPSTYSSGSVWYGISVYGNSTAKGGAWDGVSTNQIWQCNCGFPVQCSDGVGHFHLSVYSTTGTLSTIFEYSSSSNTTTAQRIIAEMSEGWKPVPRETDPFAEGGNTSTGGGTGTFDGTGDIVDFPSLPTLSATDTGFITIFNPTLAQLNALARYMWANPLFDPSTWKKIFADPMDAILGLSIVPVAVPTSGTKAVTVGNITTDVSMDVASSQFIELDCGSLDVLEYWGAYLDYEPYTKAEIYLPYIGFRPLSVDDIMGKTVSVKYHIDILSGACVAYVKCGDSVLYSFIGQCSASIPITGNDWTNVINGVINIAGAIGSTVSSGGATAPTAITTIASTAINQLKPSIQRSGSMSGTGGMLAVQTPYISLTRPRQALPELQNRYMGYPSFITEDLSRIEGYTEIEFIHLENVPATAGEISEIETLLKGGVIF